MIDVGHVYAFIGGTVVGRFAGIIPSMIVSGALMYTADPTVFSQASITHIKTTIINIISK